MGRRRVSLVRRPLAEKLNLFGALDVALRLELNRREVDTVAIAQAVGDEAQQLSRMIGLDEEML